MLTTELVSEIIALYPRHLNNADMPKEFNADNCAIFITKLAEVIKRESKLLINKYNSVIVVDKKSDKHGIFRQIYKELLRRDVKHIVNIISNLTFTANDVNIYSKSDAIIKEIDENEDNIRAAEAKIYTSETTNECKEISVKSYIENAKVHNFDTKYVVITSVFGPSDESCEESNEKMFALDALNTIVKIMIYIFIILITTTIGIIGGFRSVLTFFSILVILFAIFGTPMC